MDCVDAFTLNESKMLGITEDTLCDLYEHLDWDVYRAAMNESLFDRFGYWANKDRSVLGQSGPKGAVFGEKYGRKDY